jgi:hypothetical protein
MDYIDRIPRVLVNIYFYRGLSRKNQKRSTCQIYIKRNRPYYEKEYSRRLEKIPPPEGRAHRPGRWPIRAKLLDHASTAFEDQ